HLYMLAVAAQHGFRFDTVQMPLNLFDAHFRSFSQLVVPELVREGVGILGMKSMGNGVLLRSNTVTAPECLHYALNLPTSVDITRNGSQPSGKGPAEYFTGSVRIDPLFQSADPARAVGASVTFEPGGRTAWHTHPLGQTLIVTSGCGRAQRWAGPLEEFRAG